LECFQPEWVFDPTGELIQFHHPKLVFDNSIWAKRLLNGSLIMFDWDLHDAIARVSTYKLDATQ
jgi:hypothetical protein